MPAICLPGIWRHGGRAWSKHEEHKQCYQRRDSNSYLGWKLQMTVQLSGQLKYRNTAGRRKITGVIKESTDMWSIKQIHDVENPEMVRLKS